MQEFFRNLERGAFLADPHVTVTRRQFLARTSALSLVLAATSAGILTFSGDVLAQTASAAELEKAGPLGDVVMGDAKAPVTIIEYASMTCSHCAHFHNTTYPELKKKYIDSGKVKYILREFPLDPLAAAGFMLARCAGNDRYYAIADLLFAQQRTWAFTDKPVDALLGLMKQAGFTQETFETCLQNKSIYDAVNAVRDRAAKLGVNSTPTFFVNGQIQRGALTIEEFDKILAPLVGS